MVRRFIKNFQLIGGGIFAETMGGLISSLAVRDPLSTVTYGASMAIDASLASSFLIVPTNGVAFTLAVPTNPPPATGSQLISITIRNTTGGALGAATLTAGAGGYRLGAAWTQPANGFSRTIFFRWSGAAWVETGRTAADVAN